MYFMSPARLVERRSYSQGSAAATSSWTTRL